MAYLNCPFCPGQAVPASTQDSMLQFGMGLTKLRCIASGHFSYVETEEIYGKRQKPSNNLSQ